MSDSATDFFVKTCGGCGFSGECYRSGCIPSENCKFMAGFRQSGSFEAKVVVLQIKAVELFKWNRSSALGFDLGWCGAWEEWNREGYDLDLRTVVSGYFGYSFIEVYDLTIEQHKNRLERERNVLAGVF